MRFLAIIMIFMVSGMSAVPCCPPVVKAMDHTAQNDPADDCCSKDDKHHDSGTSETENTGCSSCSPFFSFGSCSGFTVQSWNPELPINSPFTIAYCSFKLQVVSEYSEAKWQPPKIS